MVVVAGVIAVVVVVAVIVAVVVGVIVVFVVAPGGCSQSCSMDTRQLGNGYQQIQNVVMQILRPYLRPHCHLIQLSNLSLKNILSNFGNLKI